MNKYKLLFIDDVGREYNFIIQSNNLPKYENMEEKYKHIKIMTYMCKKVN